MIALLSILLRWWLDLFEIIKREYMWILYVYDEYVELNMWKVMIYYLTRRDVMVYLCGNMSNWSCEV